MTEFAAAYLKSAVGKKNKRFVCSHMQISPLYKELYTVFQLIVLVLQKCFDFFVILTYTTIRPPPYFTINACASKYTVDVEDFPDFPSLS